MKLVSLSVAAALLIAAVAPVLAFEVEDGEILLRSRVRSSVRTESNTGGNLAISGLVLFNAQADDTSFLGYNRIQTGHADALGVNTMAVNSLVGPTANGSMEDFSLRSYARVNSRVDAYANSGNNIAVSGVLGINAEMDDLTVQATNEIYTGNASATGDSLVIVNSHWNGSL
jgi:hypothetical protein